MENGDRPAAGAHWIERAPDNFREGVIEKIVKNLSEIPGHADDLHLNKVASNYEAKVFSHSDSAESYLRTIGSGMLSIQRKWQPAAAQAASDLGQQQAQTGRHQMRPVRAAAANSSAATTTPQTAPANPPPVRPPQLQNTHLRANQAQPAKVPPVAPPAVQLHQTVVVTQIQNSSQQPQPRMNQQQSYQTPNGQHADVAVTQARQCGGQKNDEQSGNLHPAAGEVDWREDTFRKITSLKDAHSSELAKFAGLLEHFQPKANGQLEPLTKEQADQRKLAAHTIGRIKAVLSFLGIQKADISEGAMDQLDKLDIHGLVRTYRGFKARSAAKRQSQNCREPQTRQATVSIGGATDNGKQNGHEQHAAEALSHSSQDAPSGTPLALQENHSDNSVEGEAEDNSVRGEAESLVALNLPGDTPPLTGTTCSQEMQQMHPADEAIPQLTQSIVEPAGTSTSPAEEQTHGAHPVCVKTEDDSEQVESERPVGGATDNGQQNGHEQHAATEALSHSSQDAPSGTPTQQQNHSEHMVGEAESLVAINLPGDTAPLAGTTCSQEMQQGHLAAEAIPQLTQSAEPAGTSPAQEQTHGAHLVRVKTEDDSVRAEAERPVGTEAAQIERGVNALRSLSPVAIRSLASDMGVNLKRAFPHTTPDTMDGSSISSRIWFDGESSGNSCHKKRKTCGYDDSALDEIRATSNMLVETEIKILGDDTAGGADGTMIELSYNVVSLAPKLREIICASEISTKLLVHGDYPMSSPVILGEVKMGVPGVVDKAFRRNLVLLPEPMSIEGMAKVWDSIVRRVVVQFAHRLGGGTFSSRYGQWESYIPAWKGKQHMCASYMETKDARGTS